MEVLSNGQVVGCYNSTLGAFVATSLPCDITVATSLGARINAPDFHFPVNNRFVMEADVGNLFARLPGDREQVKQATIYFQSIQGNTAVARHEDTSVWCFPIATVFGSLASASVVHRAVRLDSMYVLAGFPAGMGLVSYHFTVDRNGEEFLTWR